MKVSKFLVGYLNACRRKKSREIFKKLIAVTILITFILSTANVTYIPQAFAAETVNPDIRPANYVPQKPSYSIGDSVYTSSRSGV